MNFNDPFYVDGKPTASAETQVKYLMQVVKVKEAKIKDLEMRLRAIDLERQLEVNKIAQQLDTIEEMLETRRKLIPTLKITKRKRPFFWWVDRILLGKERYNERELREARNKIQGR